MVGYIGCFNLSHYHPVLNKRIYIFFVRLCTMCLGVNILDRLITVQNSIMALITIQNYHVVMLFNTGNTHRLP